MPPKREDEEICKEEFEAFLRSQGISNISWDNGDEPPDYYLNTAGVRYAVEVTNLMEQVETDGRQMSHLGFRHKVTRFVRNVERQARQEGILAGAYSLRCKPRDDFASQKRRIREQLLEYIRTTQGSVAPPARVLLGRGYSSWSVEKLQSESRFLIPSVSGAKWEVEAQNELCQLLQNVLLQKTEKLRSIDLPKILLILDRYVWLNINAWTKCRKELKGSEEFHTVFGVSRSGQSCMLHTIEKSWTT
jgi:hypothetical protein